MHLGLRPGQMVKKGTQSRIHNTRHLLQLHLLHSASEHKPFLLVANAGSPWKTLDPCETHHLLTTLNPHRDTTSCFWMQQWPLDSKPSLRRAQDLSQTTLRFSGFSSLCFDIFKTSKVTRQTTHRYQYPRTIRPARPSRVSLPRLSTRRTAYIYLCIYPCLAHDRRVDIAPRTEP
jgi:hypothetical protein